MSQHGTLEFPPMAQGTPEFIDPELALLMKEDIPFCLWACLYAVTLNKAGELI